MSWRVWVHIRCNLYSRPCEFTIKCHDLQHVIAHSLIGMGLIQASPTPLHHDNDATSCLAEDHMWHLQVKHIQVKYHSICKLITNSELTIMRVWSCDSIANILTKPLTCPNFLCLHKLLLWFVRSILQLSVWGVSTTLQTSNSMFGGIYSLVRLIFAAEEWLFTLVLFPPLQVCYTLFSTLNIVLFPPLQSPWVPVTQGSLLSRIITIWYWMLLTSSQYKRKFALPLSCLWPHQSTPVSMLRGDPWMPL